MPGATKAIREAAPGVLAIKVDIDQKRVTLATAKDDPLPREEIIEALKTHGYSGQWAEE